MLRVVCACFALGLFVAACPDKTPQADAAAAADHRKADQESATAKAEAKAAGDEASKAAVDSAKAAEDGAKAAATEMKAKLEESAHAPSATPPPPMKPKRGW